MQNTMTAYRESVEDISTMGEGVKSYVAKNQYGYSTVGIIIDFKNRKYQLMAGMQMPIQKHKVISKKKIYEMAQDLKNAGFERVHGTGDIAYTEQLVKKHCGRLSMDNVTKFKRYLKKNGMGNLLKEEDQVAELATATTDGGNETVKEWYVATFPDDELGSDLEDGVTFEDVYDCLKGGCDIYSLLKVGDSIVRERIFNELANRRGVSYDTIYDMWVRSTDKEEIKEGLTEEKKHLTEGPGAGYSIETKGLNVDGFITSANVVGNTDLGYTIVECDCKISGYADEIYAQSYYYGTGEIENVPVEVTKVVFQLADAEGRDEDGNLDLSILSDIAIDDLNSAKDIKDIYGGGWSHSTWDGTLVEATTKDKVKFNGVGWVTSATIKVTDKAVIEFVDKAVQGENTKTTFEVRDEDDDWLESFDTQEDAIEYAKQDRRAVEVIRYEDYYDIHGETYSTSESETVWKREDEEEVEEGLKRTTVNISESLNTIDQDTCCEYDLYNLYESYNYSDEQKKNIATMLHENKSPKEIYDFMWNIYEGR